MFRSGIGTKVLLVTGTIFILFTAGLATIIGTTSFNNLRDVKQAELDRMSLVLASRISETRQNAERTALSFETNELVVEELQQLTGRGPYYAEPGSFIEPVDFTSGSRPIEDADQVFNFQSKLNLLELLQATQRLNKLSSISFYMLSPFDMLPGAKPILAFRLDEDRIYITRFLVKGNADEYKGYRVYQIPADDFSPPPPDYFDISSAYSVPPEEFYTDNNFAYSEPTPNVRLSDDMTILSDVPQSRVVIQHDIPVIQTWYPVKIPIANPETWEQEFEPVGVVVIEQKLDSAVADDMKALLGLDVGFAQDNELLVSSLRENIPLGDAETVAFSKGEFYYAQADIRFTDIEDTNLTTVVLSPRSELDTLTDRLQSQIGIVAIVSILLAGVVVYMSIHYLVNRPLKAMTDGVEQITAGDLSHPVPVHSQDELGQLAQAFNSMAKQLQDLISSLEQRVEERTGEIKEANQVLSRRATQLEASSEVGRQVTSMINLERLLRETVALIQAKFHYYFVGVWLLDGVQERLILEASAERGGTQRIEKGFAIAMDTVHSITASVVQSGEFHLAIDVNQDEQYLALDGLPETRAELALPLTVGQEIAGVLDIQSDREEAFDREDITVLQSLANQIGIAIRNARLITEAQEAREIAEQGSRIKSQFLASVSHELRTPLNSILNFTKFVATGKMGEVNNMQIDALNNVIASGTHLLNLINDVLDISKIEAGALQLFMEDDVNLEKELQMVTTTARSILKDKPVELKLEVADNIPAVRVDKQRFNQIMLNLVSNACKFTDEGFIAIQASRQDGEVMISVQDTGPGIALEDHEVIFEIFRQTQRGIQQGSGTGLGLAISKRLIEAHGGRIWLESAEGQGTTFFIALPIPGE